MPGAAYTAIEVFVVIVMGLLIATVLAVARLVFRAIRGRHRPPPPNGPTT